jgi:hypothetical protein
MTCGLDAAGCRLVTRFKANTPLSVIEDRPAAGNGAVLSDRAGYLPARLDGPIKPGHDSRVCATPGNRFSRQDKPPGHACRQ